MRRLMLLLLACFVSTATWAYERTEVCAKYKRAGGWSQGYQVEATLIKGDELNRRTRTYDYTPYSLYVTIFWDEGQASVIEMDLPQVYYGSQGRDQSGRLWEISRGQYSCF